ncbi:MAG: putative manganese transporter [Phycicoccus sp.]
MTALLLGAMADAFLEVGVFVGILVVAFGWLRWRHGDRLIGLLGAHRAWGPAVGALLGVSPGCAGAILVMPLYARGRVSFGTAIAALVATMGDSSWVIMAGDPSAALLVHGMLLATGLATGYIVDAVGVAPRPTPQQDDARAVGRRAGAGVPRVRDVVGSLAQVRRTVRPVERGSEQVGDGVGPVGRGGGAPGARPVPAALVDVTPGAAVLPSPLPLSVVFWVLTGAGFLLGAPVAFRLLDTEGLRLSLGVDPYVVLGTLGFAAALAVLVRAHGEPVDDLDGTGGAAASGPFSTVLAHGARETAFVIVWVGAIYSAWALVQHVTGFDGSQLPLHGLLGVVVGAAVGLIPGCAVQIVFTGLYLSGAVPMSTLVANAVSQDGDALLPLLALDRRAALLATTVTTVPGVLVGGAVLLLT